MHAFSAASAPSSAAPCRPLYASGVKRRLRWAVIAAAGLLVPALAIADDEVPEVPPIPRMDDPAGGAVAEQATPPAAKKPAAPKQQQDKEKDKPKDDTVVKEKDKPKDDAAKKQVT